MSDSTLPLLQGIQAALKASGPVTALVGTRVYGVPPANPQYPFIVVSSSPQPFEANDFSGMEHQVTVQAFTRENRPGAALTIRQKVFDALNRNEPAITVVGNTLVLFQQDGIWTDFPEPDGRTHQAVAEFKAIVI